MNQKELEKSKIFKAVEVLEYIPNSVGIKPIVKKPTGNISAMSFDSGSTLMGKVSPFDTFILVINGEAEIVIDDQTYLIETGQFIIIPAHARSTIKAIARFKILSAIIKSGYEEVS